MQSLSQYSSSELSMSHNNLSTSNSEIVVTKRQWFDVRRLLKRIALLSIPCLLYGAFIFETSLLRDSPREKVLGGGANETPGILTKRFSRLLEYDRGSCCVLPRVPRADNDPLSKKNASDKDREVSLSF